MSQDNAELVRSICRAWERGDYSSVEWAHPEIEYVHVGGPASGLDLGQMQAKAATLFTVRGAEVTRLVNYLDSDALADLGLAE